MKQIIDKETLKEMSPMHIRKLTKSGGSRYLSVGTILPPTWDALKVYVVDLDSGGCILVLEPIK